MSIVPQANRTKGEKKSWLLKGEGGGGTGLFLGSQRSPGLVLLLIGWCTFLLASMILLVHVVTF